MAKKRKPASKASETPKVKLTKAQRAELLRSKVRIVRGRIIRISATNQRLALCGEPCTCDGAGCGKIHPAGVHCLANPVCPDGCRGTCSQGAGHLPYSPSHSCPHGHDF